MEKTKIQINNRMKNILVLLILTVSIYLVFRYILPLGVPFIIAGVVSVLYYPFLRKIGKKTGLWSGKGKKWFLVFAVVILYLLLFLLAGLFGGYLLGQGQSIMLNFPFYQAKIVYLIKNCCCEVDELLHVTDGVSFSYMASMMDNVKLDSLSEMLPKVTSYSVQVAEKAFQVLFCLIITIIATFFMIQDYDGIRGKMLESEPGRGVCRVIGKCKDTLKAYVKAQGLIMLLDGILCTGAFLLIKQPYALVLGPLVAVVDALPILGAGLILIPAMIIFLLMKNFFGAVIMLLAYLGCLLIRQLTEPRMISGKVGMKPLYTIISMYAGFKLFGVCGFLLGPVGMLIGKEIYGVYQKNGFQQ